ncbi:hypothetical protein BH09MYX1_BH09MYX1_43860 [soil metagenome]
MAGVSGVSSRDKLSNEQLDALRDAESGKGLATASVLKQVQTDAGFSKKTTVRGDDATLDEVIDDQKGLKHNIAGAIALASKSVEGIEIASVHLPWEAEVVVVGSASGAALAIAAPIVGAGAMIYEVGEAGEKGRAQAEALYKDQTHVAMLVMLKLPGDFRTNELKKYPMATHEAANGTVDKLTTTMNTKDKALVAVLQLHCDQGMTAAKSACDAKISAGDYLQSHPALAERYASDPAFKAGFDAMTWSHAQGGAAYAAASADLSTRVIDYDSHRVPVRL